MMRHGVAATSEARLPFTTFGELLTGVNRAGDHTKESARLFRAVGATQVIYPTGRTLAVYAQISAELQRIGQRIPTNDLWNAALAMEWSLPLLADDAHFARVSGLKIIPVR